MTYLARNDIAYGLAEATSGQHERTFCAACMLSHQLWAEPKASCAGRGSAKSRTPCDLPRERAVNRAVNRAMRPRRVMVAGSAPLTVARSYTTRCFASAAISSSDNPSRLRSTSRVC